MLCKDELSLIQQWSNFAIRRGPWKYIQLVGPPQLYNLENDPGETANLAPTQLGMVQILRGALNAWSDSVSP